MNNLEEFRQSIRNCAPSIDILVSNGFDESEVSYIQKPYNPEIINALKNNDKLVELCMNLKFEGNFPFEISFIMPFETDKFWVVGYQESDILCVRKADNRVLVVQSDTPDFEIYVCAINGEKFINAFVYFLENYYKSNMLNRAEIASDCARLASDDKSIVFWRNALSIY